jgi:hypothetical protein
MTEPSETQWLREQLGKQLDKSVDQGEAIAKQEGIVEEWNWKALSSMDSN